MSDLFLLANVPEASTMYSIQRNYGYIYDYWALFVNILI